MNTKKLYNALLLSSTLILTACSGGDSLPTDSKSNPQAELSKITSDLKSIQDQEAQVSRQLITANQEVNTTKQALDALQSKLETGEVSVTEVLAAETAYENALDIAARLERQKAELADQARKLQERADTAVAAAKLDTSLNNAGSAVLSGTFSVDDLKTFMKAVNSKTAAQLVAPTNKFIADIKSGLDSGPKIKAAFPKVINSPIIDSLVIPLMSEYLGGEIQRSAEKSMRDFRDVYEIGAGVFFEEALNVKIQCEKTEKEYKLNFSLKDAIKKLYFRIEICS